MSIVVRGVHPGPALSVTFAVALAGISFVGMAYDEAPLPWACWAILALSPAGAALSWIPAVRQHPRARAIVRGAAPAAIAGAALLVALAAIRAGTGDPPDDAYASGPRDAGWRTAGPWARPASR